VNDEGTVFVKCLKRNTGYMTGQAGYEGQSGFTGNLAMEVRNPFGFGIQIGLKWQRFSIVEQSIESELKERLKFQKMRWLFKEKFKVHFLASHYRDREFLLVNGPYGKLFYVFVGMENRKIEEYSKKRRLNENLWHTELGIKGMKDWGFTPWVEVTLSYSQNFERIRSKFGIMLGLKMAEITPHLLYFNVKRDPGLFESDKWKSDGVEFLLGYKRGSLLFNRAFLMELRIIFN
jgi:hypothetical protein